MNKSTYTTDKNGNAAVRVGTNVIGPRVSIYGVDSQGNAAVRIVGTDIPSSGSAPVNDAKYIDATLTITDSSGVTHSETASVEKHLQTLKNNETENGNAIQGIQEIIPSNAGATNPLITKNDLKNSTVNVTDNPDGTKIIRIGKTVIIAGTENVGTVGAGVATEHPVVFPVEMANKSYVVSLTPTCDGGFAQLNVDYEGEETTGFNIGLRNIGNAPSTGIKVGWLIIGDVAN